MSDPATVTLGEGPPTTNIPVEWTPAEIAKFKKNLLMMPKDPATRRTWLKCATWIVIFYFWVGPFLLTMADTWKVLYLTPTEKPAEN